MNQSEYEAICKICSQLPDGLYNIYAPFDSPGGPLTPQLVVLTGCSFVVGTLALAHPMPADGPGAYDVTLLVLYSLTVVAFAANYVHTRRSQNKAVVTVRDKLPTITYGRNTYIEPRVIAQQLAAHLEASHSSF